MSGRPPKPVTRLAAELVVIVGGVLIALGAEAWWSGREEARAEREYLLLLDRDISDLLDEVALATERETENLGNVGELGRLVVQGDPDDPFAVGYTTAGPTLRTGVLRQIDAVRGPILAGDPELRAGVGDLLVSVESTQRLGQDIFSDAVDNMRAALVEMARLQQPFGSREGITVRDARSSPEILASISFHIILLQNRLAAMDRLREDAVRVRTLLRERLDEAGIDRGAGEEASEAGAGESESAADSVDGG